MARPSADAIEQKIVEIVESLSVDEAWSGTAAMAQVVLDLAEARAWLLSPSQPHGGSARAGD